MLPTDILPLRSPGMGGGTVDDGGMAAVVVSSGAVLMCRPLALLEEEEEEDDPGMVAVAVDGVLPGTSSSAGAKAS